MFNSDDRSFEFHYAVIAIIAVVILGLFIYVVLRDVHEFSQSIGSLLTGLGGLLVGGGVMAGATGYQRSVQPSYPPYTPSSPPAAQPYYPPTPHP